MGRGECKTAGCSQELELEYGGRCEQCWRKHLSTMYDEFADEEET